MGQGGGGGGGGGGGTLGKIVRESLSGETLPNWHMNVEKALLT